MSQRSNVRRLLKKVAFEQDQEDRTGRVKMGDVTEGNMCLSVLYKDFYSLLFIKEKHLLYISG